jgi:NADH dehydrogenase FAD-containing subunit
MTEETTLPTVVVVGGGYAGIAVAKALDEPTKVTLVEPRDAFVHNIAALRAAVDPTIAPKIFLPYDRLLEHGEVIRDRAVRVDGDEVELASGKVLRPDFIVLATGSSYPYPAKTDRDESVDAIARYQHTYEQLGAARRVMLLGAGAVGLEFAGEIAAAWPDTVITLVDQSPEVLPGPYGPALRDELKRQLDELGVQRVLGASLVELPATPPGELGAFAVTTASGTRIEGDIWFRTYGVQPSTAYVAGDLVDAIATGAYLRVTPRLTVVGHDRVYAIGDIADIDINRASVAGRQAQLAASNILASIDGREGSDYAPNPASIILPLGPEHGTGQLANGDLATAEHVAKAKGLDLMIDRFTNLLAPSEG